jgi:hypothetical protein
VNAAILIQIWVDPNEDTEVTQKQLVIDPRPTTSLKASTLFEVTKVRLHPPTNGREQSHRLINIYTHFVQNGDSGWRMPLASISTKY